MYSSCPSSTPDPVLVESCDSYPACPYHPQISLTYARRSIEIKWWLVRSQGQRQSKSFTYKTSPTILMSCSLRLPVPVRIDTFERLGGVQRERDAYSQQGTAGSSSRRETRKLISYLWSVQMKAMEAERLVKCLANTRRFMRGYTPWGVSGSDVWWFSISMFRHPRSHPCPKASVHFVVYLSFPSASCDWSRFYSIFCRLVNMLSRGNAIFLTGAGISMLRLLCIGFALLSILSAHRSMSYTARRRLEGCRP